MATYREKLGLDPELPEAKCRFLKKSEAKALLAQGGWTPDPENSCSLVYDAYVSDRAELLLFGKRGHSVLYESRKACMERDEAILRLPRSYHVLEGLLPQGPHFIEAVPSLIDELAQHLKLPRQALDGSFESLYVVEAALKKIRPRERILEIPNLFAGIIAYTGEVMRKETGGVWKLKEVEGGIYEPLIQVGEDELNPFLTPHESIVERMPGGVCLVATVASATRHRDFAKRFQ